MFQGSFNGTSKKLERWCKDVSRMFQTGFKEFSRKLLFHESLESVTRKIEECFEDLEYFLEVYRVFQVLGMIQECFKEFPRMLKNVLSASMMFNDCFKVSSSMFYVFSRLFE